MGTTDGVVGAVTLHSETTVLAASRCQTSSLSVLVHRVHNPVDTRIVSDRDMLGIDQDNFVVFVGSILVNPV